ncbi:site-specific DNA-methyltransferase [Kibdelosporangium aridum]|uniref:Methyltransferase n=1 Tax=Kibdelosporangium aridum TaxID=2030 RepID=A0A428Z678_KIBAR|nr:site-specific DNA-methyltransferase [Kibdelosporangium aridum]RSM82553.1 site-specific DNA-methyltransferase [Kibdelosporangium aridum]
MSLTPDQFVNHVLVGDVRQRLGELPDACVDCVITSPPYWALRDYGHPDQIGAEPTVNDWVSQITAVCHELARVLVPHGALWLNVGDSYSRHPGEGAPRKSLLLGPARLAIQLTQAGWLLRSQVVWAKRNAMPSSVTDRLATTHEFVLFLTRQRRYFFNLDAIREPARTQTSARRSSRDHYPPREAAPTLGGGQSSRIDLNQGLSALKAAGLSSHPLGKNPGDVWRIATANYPAAHFASFPSELVRRPLLATCPQRVCTECRTPWRRATQMIDGRKLATGPLRSSCSHSGWRPGRVLDPFMGAGTVALAAEQYKRDWVGIELNPDYAALADERLAAWRAAQSKPA